MKLSLLPRVRRVLSAALALAMLASSLLSGVSFAAAGGAPPTSSLTAASPPTTSIASSPTVVAEVVASRTADSTTYRMSDGSVRTEIYDEPIHYKDDAGRWQGIDPTLVPTGAFGQAHSRATEFEQTFGAETASSTPVTVKSDDWSFGMELLGGHEAGMIAVGDTAVYPLAQTETQLSYETLRNGVKDTLVLASSKAPDTFSFFVRLENLGVYAEPGTSEFALLRSDTGKRVGRIQPLAVYDSAETTAGGASCQTATMRVVPVDGGAYVTYSVPRSWLDDPARVYPVYVDPAVTFSGTGDTRNDTFVAKGDSAYHYADNHLDASTYASGAARRALVNFNLNSIPNGAAINSALLQMYQWQNSSGGSFTMNAQPVVGSWGYNATWANSFGNGSVAIGGGGDSRSVPAGANQYVIWNMTNAVQRWFAGSMANNGFVLYSSNESAVCQHSFYSAEYASPTSRQPHLVVDYTPPAVTAEPIKTAYRAGDTIAITLHANSRAVTNLQARVEGKTSTGASALQTWFAFTEGELPAPWVSTEVDDGFISYYPTPATESRPAVGIEPILSACSATSRADGRDVTFVYRIGAGHADIQSNRLTTYDPDWQTGWQDQTQAYSVKASRTATPSAAATATASWFAEVDSNADGSNDARNDSGACGRGSIELSWKPASAASGYGIYLFDGNQYQRVATSTATTWSTAGKRLYPSDSAIVSMALGFAGNPFADGALDLRDDPRPLYAKTLGTVLDNTPSYLLKVVPFNSAGAVALSECATVTVALEGRTRHLFDAPSHTEADLGSLYGNSASVRLDRGDFTLATNDLEIPGAGPTLAIDRVYRSSTTATAGLASGWRFGFERSVSASGAIATYIDTVGDMHTFVKRGGAWVAPVGETDVLTGDAASGFTLTHKDRTRTTFDSAGRLVAETDGTGNTVRYEWAGDGSSLTIRSPKDTPLVHERRITVAFSGGRATRATAHVVGGDDRVVTYDAQPNALTVVRLPGTDAESTLLYRYDDSHRISQIAVPGFSAGANGEAVWAVAYGAASITVANETGGGTPRMPRTVSWDSAKRCGWVASASGTSTITFDVLGRQASSTKENTSAASVLHYDVNGNEIGSESPTGRRTRSACDGRGNVISATDENGAVTTYTYADDFCVAEADPRGASTVRWFDQAGRLLSEEKTLNDDGERSHVEFTYNSDGTRASERKQIDATRTAVTEYSDYADSGEAQTTTLRGVEIAQGRFADLVSHAWVDGYGALKTAVDANAVTTVSNMLDAVGREIESCDASGTVTHTRYGVLGETTKTWRSNPCTTTVVDWVETAVNGAGDVIAETMKATGGAIVSTTVHSYDAAGREVRSDDSAVPGVSKQDYDAQGNVGQSWEEGADTSVSAASQRSTFNSEGEEVVSTGPGATTASTVTSYTPTGELASSDDPDGLSTGYTYDGAGDVSIEAEETDDGLAQTVYQRDLDGRTTAITEADGTDASVDFDLDGNEIAAGLDTQTQTTKLVNVLGWTLATSEFDGTMTSTKYDALGRAVDVTVGGLSTHTDYDGFGRVARQVNADGSTVMNSYDCFGRQVGSVESSGSVVVRAENVAFDAAGREGSVTVAGQGGASSSGSFYGADGTVATTRVSRSLDASVTRVVDGAERLRTIAAQISGLAIDFSVTATDSAGREAATRSSALPVARARTWTQAGQLARSVLGSATAEYTYSAISGRKVRDTRHSALTGRDEVTDFDYDIGGRLVAASVNGETTRYGYDARAGELLGIRRGAAAMETLLYEAGGTGRLTSLGSRRYASDSLGRRVSSGSTTNPAEWQYSWKGDRLSHVAGPSVAASYAYDASGQRLQSVVTSGGVTTTTGFDYDGDRLAGFSAKRSDGATWSIGYVYDATGQLFAGVYASSTSSATPFLIETSDRGDVRGLLDASGAAFAEYSYEAYGVPTDVRSAGTGRVSAVVAAAIAARQPLRYSAYVFDAESGLYYCSARYFDPAAAAFISKDPARADGEESPYQYCAGDPVGRSDPTGTMYLTIHSRDKFKLVRTRLVAAAKKLVDWKLRYSHGDHVQIPKRGGQMDCSGAVAWVLRKGGTWFSHRIPKPTSGSRWNTDSFVQHLTWKSRHWNKKRFAEGYRWHIGDVLVRGWSGDKMGHIVMVVRDGGSPKLFECAGSARGKYREGARFIPMSVRLSSWKPLYSGRFFDYEPTKPYGGRI